MSFFCCDDSYFEQICHVFYSSTVSLPFHNKENRVDNSVSDHTDNNNNNNIIIISSNLNPSLAFSYKK